MTNKANKVIINSLHDSKHLQAAVFYFFIEYLWRGRFAGIKHTLLVHFKMLNCENIFLSRKSYRKKGSVSFCVLVTPDGGI